MKKVLLLILISVALAAPTEQCRTETRTYHADFNSWVLSQPCGLGSLRSAVITNTGPNTVKAQGQNGFIWINPGGSVSMPSIYAHHGETWCSIKARTEKGPWHATLQGVWELCTAIPNLVPRGNASMKPVHWNETMECATTYEDGDNDPDQSVKRLYVNGVEQSSNYTHFDNITCEYIPCDAWDCGQAVSVTVGVLNYAPVVTSTSISEVHFNESFWCNYSFYDGEGDADNTTTKTFINGVEKNITNYSHFDNITCEFVPFDGYVHGNAVNASTTVLNYAPSVLNVSLPVNISVEENITFSYQFYDADDDDNKTIVTWFRNNTKVNGTQNKSAGDTFVLQLTPFDGFEFGEIVNTTVEVYEPEEAEEPDIPPEEPPTPPPEPSPEPPAPTPNPPAPAAPSRRVGGGGGGGYVRVVEPKPKEEAREEINISNQTMGTQESTMVEQEQEIALPEVAVQELPEPLPITAAVPARQDNIVLAGGVLVFSLLAGFKVKNRLSLGELGDTWKKWRL